MTDQRSTPSSGRARTLLLTAAAAGLLIASVLLALARVTSLGSLGGLRLDASASAMSDFKSTIYYPAKAFADGANPYDTGPYLARYPAPEPVRLYPPSMLLVARPFAALSLETAVYLQVLLTLVLSGVLAYVSLRLAQVPTAAWAVLLVWALILFSRPGQWNLLQGQATLWMVLGTYAALAAPRRAALLAGAGLAVALLKPNFGIPAGALMLAQGQVAGAAIGVAVAGAMNLAVVLQLADRAGGLHQLASMFMTGTDRLRDPAGTASEFAVFRVDAGALPSQVLGGHLGLVPSLILAASLIGLVWVLLRRKDECRETASPNAVMSGVLCCTVLVSLYHIGYDLLLLAWPFVALASRMWSAPRSGPLHRWLQLGLFALLAGNYASTFSVISALQASGPILTLLTSLNGLALLALFALYLYEFARPALARAPSASAPIDVAPVMHA